MQSETLSTAPETEQHPIDSSPAGIPLERWRQMFAVYTGSEDSQHPVSRYKLTEWQAFGRFLNGQLNDEVYYAKNNNLRSHVEAIAYAFSHSKFDEYRPELNAALHTLVQQSRQNLHWKKEAMAPQTRMYLDAARLVNRRLINSLSQWEANKFTAPGRASYEAQVDDKISEAFDEALLSPDLDSGNFGGFTSDIMRKRIVDFHRARAGRSESAREKRPRFMSLDQPVNGQGDGGEFTPLNMITGDNPLKKTHAIAGDELLETIRRFAEALPTRRRQVLMTFLDEKARNEDATPEDMAASIGMAPGTFHSNLATIRAQLIESKPDLKKAVIQFFGATPELIRRFDERQADKDHAHAAPTAEAAPAEIPAPVLNRFRALTVKPKEVYMTAHKITAHAATREGYEAYKQSFGMQIKLRRDERNMTLQNVADGVSQAISSSAGISSEQVKRWEQGRELPGNEQAFALAIVLIDENEAVLNKEEAHKAFMEAFTRSQAAADGRDTGDDRYAFADMLSEYREKYRNIDNMTLSLEGLARKASKHTVIGIDAEEQALLEREPRDFIAAIEAGVLIPSKGMATALIKALDKVKPIETEEKHALHYALEHSAQAVAAQGFSWNGAYDGDGNRLSASHDEEAAQSVAVTQSVRNPKMGIPARARELKSEIRALFAAPDDKDFTLTKLALAIGMDQTRLSVLMSSSNNLNPAKTAALTPAIKDKLINYLKTHDRQDKVEEFEKLFTEMCQVTNYTGRRISRPASADAGVGAA